MFQSSKKSTCYFLDLFFDPDDGGGTFLLLLHQTKYRYITDEGTRQISKGCRGVTDDDVLWVHPVHRTEKFAVGLTGSQLPTLATMSPNSEPSLGEPS
jgi:hypothetical protein